MSRLCVPHDHEHLVVHILVWNGVAVLVPRRDSDERVILHLELAVGLPHDDHGLCVGIDLLWLRANGDKLDIIVDSQDLASRLRLDVLLGDVLGLVVEEAMRVTRPGDAAHVDLVLLTLGCEGDVSAALD